MTAIDRGPLAALGPWRPPARYWHGSEPELDLVADAVTGPRTLVGEAWFSKKPVTQAVLAHEAARLQTRPVPRATAGRDIVRVLYVPTVAPRTPRIVGGVHVVTAADILR